MPVVGVGAVVVDLAGGAGLAAGAVTVQGGMHAGAAGQHHRL